MKKKKIVIITGSPSPYRVAHYKFLQQAYTDYEFHIVFIQKKSKSELRKWVVSTDELENVHYLSVFNIVKKGRYDNKQLSFTRGVGKKLKSIMPDAVVCMEYNPTSVQTMFWCKRKKVPYISLTDGTLHSERHIGRFQKWTRKYIMKNSAAFIASSTKAKEKIEFYRKDGKIFVSLLSVDIDRYLFERQTVANKGQLCYVGSLIERKGIDLLFTALSKVKNDFTLKIVGDGPLKEELLAQAEQLGFSKKIEFCGYMQTDELNDIYRSSCSFVFPTREDCYGLVIIEAMCASLPVISSKYADGAYDIITPGEDGEIVDPEDSEAFAATIDKIIEQTSENNNMGLRAYEKAKEFAFEKVSVEFMKAVSYVLNETADNADLNND